MPLPPIAVEIAPADSPPELRHLLLDACSRAVQETTCVEASSQSAETPVVVAIVSWRDENNVRLEVALRVERRWMVRDVTFSASDDRSERWRAAGLVIGTLASVVANDQSADASAPGASPEMPAGPEMESGAAPAHPPALPAPASAAPVRPSSPPSIAPRAPASTRRPPTSTVDRRERGGSPTSESSGWLELVGTVGTGLDEGPWRAGGELAGRVLAPRIPLFASVGITLSTTVGRVDGVAASWAELVSGLGYRYELGRSFWFQGRAEGLVQRFAVSLLPERGADGPRSGNRWIGGARAGAEMAWWMFRSFGVVFGGTASWYAGTTDISSGGEHVAASTPFAFAIRGGLAYGFH